MSPKNLAVAFCLVGLAAVAGAQRPEQRPAAKPDPAVRAAQKRALQTGGVRAAAAVTGQYFGYELAEEDAVVSTLAQMAAASEAIVVGRLEANGSWLDRTGNIILTDYQLSVEESLAGKLRVGDTVTISVPGGKVQFDDGSVAQTSMPNVPPPINGERYAMFLQKSYFLVPPTRRPETHGQVFTPTGRSLGMFLLTDDRGVVAKAPPTHVFKREFARLDQQAFKLAVQKGISDAAKGKLDHAPGRGRGK